MFVVDQVRLSSFVLNIGLYFFIKDYYGDDRNRDVYLDDYELDELDDDERDNDYGHDSWGMMTDNERKK